MSIGIYSFLRIYFLGFVVSVFAQFRTHCARPPAPPPPRSAWRGLSGIGCRSVQRVQRPGVCIGARPVVCGRSGCAGVGRGAPAGHTAATQPRPVSLPTTEKIKKTRPTFTNPNPSDCASLQKFQKIQKDPFRSLDCAIIS